MLLTIQKGRKGKEDFFFHNRHMSTLFHTSIFFSVFGQAKLCKFDGFHYCYECHLDDERSVPARILFNWDFRKHRVCVRSCEFLDSIEVSPILNLEDINKALYQYIPELEQAKVSPYL